MKKQLKIALALCIPLSIIYSDAALALSSYPAQMDSYCVSIGRPRATPTQCSDCHSGGVNTIASANTPLALQYKSGNYAAFCPAATPTPPPTPKPHPVPGKHKLLGGHDDDHRSGSSRDD